MTQREEPDHADGHVRAVEAGQREERHAEDVGGQSEAFAIEGGELEELTTEEDQPQRCGGTEPDAQARAGCPAESTASASTMVSELISSTKALIEVYGMSRISCGTGPTPWPASNMRSASPR